LWSFVKESVSNNLLQGLAGVKSGICTVTVNIGADVYRWAEQNYLFPAVHVTEFHDGLIEGVLK
jgi:hypothetical protein